MHTGEPPLSVAGESADCHALLARGLMSGLWVYAIAVLPLNNPTWNRQTSVQSSGEGFQEAGLAEAEAGFGFAFWYMPTVACICSPRVLWWQPAAGCSLLQQPWESLVTSIAREAVQGHAAHKQSILGWALMAAVPAAGGAPRVDRVPVSVRLPAGTEHRAEVAGKGCSLSISAASMPHHWAKPIKRKGVGISMCLQQQHNCRQACSMGVAMCHWGSAHCFAAGCKILQGVKNVRAIR